MDLQAFLPSNYFSSEALNVYTSGGTRGSSGLRYPSLGQFDAMLWEDTVPEPTSVLPLVGGLIGMAGFALRRRRS